MTGTVTSNKMTKALVVTVYTTKLHPIYKKRFKNKKKFVARCADSSTFRIGQEVNLLPSRPLSKTIRWVVE